jgi:integrase
MEHVEPIRDRKKIDAMKRYLKGTRKRDWCLFVLGINSGLRISDLLQLTVGDVLDDRGQIKARICLREKKTGKSKKFPISDSARKVILEYLEDTRGINHDVPLFPSRTGYGAIQRNQAYKILKKAAQAVGIKDAIGTHSLRKTFGYHAYQSGVDVSILQKIFNHSAPCVTLRYIGITQDDMDEVYLNLNL